MTLGFSTGLRVAVVALLVCLFVAGTAPTRAEAATAGEIRDGLEEKINRARANHGLRRLRVNLTIQRYAQGHAHLMGDLNSMFHDTANLWNEMPSDVEWVSENVGYVPGGAGTVRRMHKAFMGSAGHRANILKPRATHMGLGVVKRNGTVWVVERFADRR